MFDNGGLVKLHRMGVVMYCWIKHATRRKKEPCPKCRKRKVQKMLSLSPSAMDRLNYQLGLQRDRFIRHESVRNDFALGLPPSIPLPDGEEYGNSIWAKTRDPQQESEITDMCIRPPPNRTISPSEVEPLPPYAVYLATGRRPTKKSGDLLERTARCFGMKRAEEPIPTPPPQPPLCVYVPVNVGNRSRELASFGKNRSMDLDTVPGVSCSVPAQNIPANCLRQAAPGTTHEQKPGSLLSGFTTGVPARASAPAAIARATAGTSALTSATAGTSASAAAAKSAPALNDYIDTKGPATRAERRASAYYAGAYSDA